MHLGAPGTDKVRNVVLVGHGGAGKTSLAEAMLYLSGATKRLGTVDDGHSGLDYDPEEIKRKFSINLSLAPVVHDGVKINIIDTPGYADFVGDAIAGMEAAEMALFVVDAVSGPQVQTERLWKIAGDMGIARAVFVNRMDKEHADFDAGHGGARRQVRPPRRCRADPDGRRGRLPRRHRHHPHEGLPPRGRQAKQVLDIPAEFTDAAEAAREKLTDLVAEADETLMEKYLEGETPQPGGTRERCSDKAIAQGIFIPVFVGSALKLQGIEDLMDEIVSFFPEPTAHGADPDRRRRRGPRHDRGRHRRPRLQDDLRPLRRAA